MTSHNRKSSGLCFWITRGSYKKERRQNKEQSCFCGTAGFVYNDLENPDLIYKRDPGKNLQHKVRDICCTVLIRGIRLKGGLNANAHQTLQIFICEKC